MVKYMSWLGLSQTAMMRGFGFVMRQESYSSLDTWRQRKKTALQHIIWRLTEETDRDNHSTHIVDDVPLRLVVVIVLWLLLVVVGGLFVLRRPGALVGMGVDRTDDVHLVVLERKVVLVHIDNVVRVVDAEAEIESTQ